nr:MAG TPA: hypothetical protein [Caudoviricetes sp.]
MRYSDHLTEHDADIRKRGDAYALRIALVQLRQHIK